MFLLYWALSPLLLLATRTRGQCVRATEESVAYCARGYVGRRVCVVLSMLPRLPRAKQFILIKKEPWLLGTGELPGEFGMFAVFGFVW